MKNEWRDLNQNEKWKWKKFNSAKSVDFFQAKTWSSIHIHSSQCSPWGKVHERSGKGRSAFETKKEKNVFLKKISTRGSSDWVVSLLPTFNSTLQLSSVPSKPDATWRILVTFSKKVFAFFLFSISCCVFFSPVLSFSLTWSCKHTEPAGGQRGVFTSSCSWTSSWRSSSTTGERGRKKLNAITVGKKEKNCNKPCWQGRCRGKPAPPGGFRAPASAE